MNIDFDLEGAINRLSSLAYMAAELNAQLAGCSYREDRAGKILVKTRNALRRIERDAAIQTRKLRKLETSL